jgi:hypothetical protein
VRRLSVALLAATLIIFTSACKRAGKQKPETATQSASAPMASNISMGDVSYSSQLLRGFHGVESNAWRWTQKDFAVALGAPTGSEHNGATLALRFSVPEVVIQKLKTVTLSASVNGLALSPQQYTSSGFYTYKREIPADRLQRGQAVVEFSLDKALEPGEVERRQLGIIASQVGLESK